MSRKCSACKKWLATGQFLCKCGAGETKQLLSETVLSACEKLIASLGQTNVYSRWYGVDEAKNKELCADCVAKATVLCQDEKVARHLATKHDFVVGLVQCNAPDLLRRVLPLVPQKLHEVKHHNVTLINAAVLCGRLRCLQALLEDKTRFDATVADSTGHAPFELCALMDEDYRSVIWGKTGFFTLVLFGDKQLQRSDQVGNQPMGMYNSLHAAEDDAADVRPEEHHKLIADMLSLLASATGRGSVLKGHDGMALRAQQAAVAGEVQTPPPFSRVIWVLIVDKCELRERTIVLPRVCRFFRNLALPRDRCIEILKYFDLKTHDVGNSLENPAFVHAICRSFAPERVEGERSHEAYGWGMSWAGSSVSGNATYRLCAALKNEKMLTDPTLPFLREFMLAPLAKRTVEERLPAHPDRESFRVHRETASGLYVTCSSDRHATRGIATVKVRIGGAGKGAVTFSYKGIADRFGQVHPSFECHKRQQEGFEKVAAIWNCAVPLDGKLISQLMTLICSGLQPETYFASLFQFSGDGFRVKFHADELEQSQEFASDDFSGVSMIKALMWTPAQLAEFFEKNGISGATVLKKKLGGRALVEAKSFSIFHDDSLKPKEAHEIQERIASLKVRHFAN